MIKIEHLEKNYGNVCPIKDVNCEINKGDVISIIGPSGTGKSTFLRMIDLLEKPTNGKIYVDNEDILSKNVEVHKIRAKIVMVFQNFNLFPHLTIIENITMAPMDLKKISKQKAFEKGFELLKKVGLLEKAFCYPEELSGGQKQRVAIARALAMEPEVILFDEPTSALDPTMTYEVEKVISDLAKNDMTMLIVTHSMEFAKNVSSRIFFMDEGIIYEEGTPNQIFDAPQRQKTKDFVYRLKTYSKELQKEKFDYLEIASEIDIFCKNQYMSKKEINEVELLFEEICIGNMFKNHKDIQNICLIIEYFTATGEIKFTINYDGKKNNIIDTMDSLSMEIINSIVNNKEYQEINEGIYTNKLLIFLNK